MFIMKKILLLTTLAIGGIMVNTANAQVHVNVNIGVQPAWGPAGYDYAEYYYLPDIEAYYCVPRREFVYFDGGRWLFSANLPGRCGNYDLYSGYKVVLNERDPWCHFNEHRSMYAPYRYRHDQVIIRDGRGYGNGGYYGRPYYDNRRNDDRGYGRGRDWDRDRDNGRGRRDRDDDRHDNGRHNGWGHGRGRW